MDAIQDDATILKMASEMANEITNSNKKGKISQSISLFRINFFLRYF